MTTAAACRVALVAALWVVVPCAVHVRPAEQSDVGFLVQVVTETRSGTGVERDDAWLEEVRQRISRDVADGNTYVVQFDGRDAGRMQVIRTPGSIHLAGLQILPAFQSRGLGTALIRALMDEARSTGGVLRLEVRTSNHRARRLYERLGFRVAGTSDDEVLMRWSDGLTG